LVEWKRPITSSIFSRRNRAQARHRFAEPLHLLRRQVLEDLGGLLFAYRHQQDRGVFQTGVVHGRRSGLGVADPCLDDIGDGGRVCAGDLPHPFELRGRRLGPVEAADSIAGAGACADTIMGCEPIAFSAGRTAPNTTISVSIRNSRALPNSLASPIVSGCCHAGVGRPAATQAG